MQSTILENDESLGFHTSTQVLRHLLLVATPNSLARKVEEANPVTSAETIFVDYVRGMGPRISADTLTRDTAAMISRVIATDICGYPVADSKS